MSKLKFSIKKLFVRNRNKNMNWIQNQLHRPVLCIAVKFRSKDVKKIINHHLKTFRKLRTLLCIICIQMVWNRIVNDIVM